MDRYVFPADYQKLLESFQVPFAIYQFVNQRVATIVLSDGLLKIFGYEDRTRAYYDMEHNMYRNAHPDDVARVADAAIRFAREGGDYDVIYRSRTDDNPEYRIIHALGKHVTTDTGVRLAQVWYTDEGSYSEANGVHGNGLICALTNALHEESILRASYYDYLTGLPSMTYFFELAEESKEAIRAEGGNPALLYMDFSGMKFYNTKHGFAEGDKLLRAFSRILIRIFGMERCCRIGADHFAVQTEQDGLEEKIERLLRECSQMNDGKTLPLHVGVYPRQTERVHTSVACDRAKLACSAISGTYGTAVNYYSQDLNDEALRKQYIIENIDRAIEEKWIQVYYQAIIRVANDRVCDEEALSRWIDPVKGFLSPADFIPALEESKLIYKLDLYVVEQVLEKMKKQAEMGIYLVPQSVNLSRSDFDSLDIVEEIRRRVDDAGVDRSMLTIEITESVIGSDFEFMKGEVERFQKLGFQVWMDDFGSGYSSLDVLQSIHFDLIKLDMRFMQQFDSGEECRIILTELARMALGLGVETVCEGVETAEQIEFLREIGCTKAQGFYYGRPTPFQELIKLHELHVDMRFENPEETEYYTTLGRINLYDMAVVANEGDELLRRYFDTMPMALIEVNGSRAQYIRCNRSYRDFMERLFNVTMTGQEISLTEVSDRHAPAFMDALMRCSRDGNRAVIDEPVDEKTIVHSFIRRICVNPVTGTTAIAIAVVSVMEGQENHNASFAEITRALSSDYINLYYVDLNTEEFIEYTPDAGKGDLAVERRGGSFFGASVKDARLFLFQEDREAFIESFTRDNVLRKIDEEGSFTLTYRLLMNQMPVYVRMKAVRVRTDTRHILISVCNVDDLVRRETAPGRLPQEKLQVQCFGRFEVFWQGKPLRFERRQTRELFALLIDSKGAIVTLEEACNALWENESDLKLAKHRIRNLIGDMRKTFAAIGLEELLVLGRGYYSIRPELVECDYYRSLDGDLQSMDSFCGNYMEQYSWAEATKGELFFRMMEKK